MRVCIKVVSWFRLHTKEKEETEREEGQRKEKRKRKEKVLYLVDTES